MKLRERFIYKERDVWTSDVLASDEELKDLFKVREVSPSLDAAHAEMEKALEKYASYPWDKTPMSEIATEALAQLRKAREEK